jgi:hypothetical protein
VALPLNSRCKSRRYSPTVDVEFLFEPDRILAREGAGRRVIAQLRGRRRRVTGRCITMPLRELSVKDGLMSSGRTDLQRPRAPPQPAAFDTAAPSSFRCAAPQTHTIAAGRSNGERESGKAKRQQEQSCRTAGRIRHQQREQAGHEVVDDVA